MKNLEKLKKDLDVIKLEDRLEMVSVLAAEEVDSGGNGVCCCSDPQ